MGSQLWNTVFHHSHHVASESSLWFTVLIFIPLNSDLERSRSVNWVGVCLYLLKDEHNRKKEKIKVSKSPLWILWSWAFVHVGCWGWGGKCAASCGVGSIFYATQWSLNGPCHLGQELLSAESVQCGVLCTCHTLHCGSGGLWLLQRGNQEHLKQYDQLLTSLLLMHNACLFWTFHQRVTVFLFWGLHKSCYCFIWLVTG